MSSDSDKLAERPIGLVMAAALTALAGAVDACGLARLKDLYVSFMSGNSTSLAVALGQGDWPRVALAASLVGLFVAGAVVGEVLGTAAGRWRLPAITVAVAAGLAVPLAVPRWTIPALALSMGALNAAMQRAGGTSVGLTFVTGSLVRLGRGLGQTLCGNPGHWAWLRQGVPWLGLVAGASAASVMPLALGAGTLWPLPVAALLLGVLAWRLER